MKLSTNTNNYRTNITKAADFGIQDNDLSHIMGILRSQIYSDKLLAVIREYSTNAVDANVEAGKTASINVHLPTIAEPTLSFRDYGNGLTDDEVCNLYVKYGASTKRSSNDYTGCLGIGCKAGFAYGSTFNVISYTKNHITTWLARIDESQRGTISMLNKEPNALNVPTGTRVEVSIRKQDIDQCVEKAKQFFMYWKTKPAINVTLPELNIFESTDDWAIKRPTDSYSRFHGSASLVMGNIRYPIDTNNANLNNDAACLLSTGNVILYAPLGAVDIAANRESLEYSDRTRNALVAISNNMLIDLASKLGKIVSNEASRIKASIKSHHYDNMLPDNIVSLIKSKTKWNKQELITNISLSGSGRYMTKHYRKKKSWRNDDMVNAKDKDLAAATLTQNMTICVHDTDNIPLSNATRRIRTLQNNNNNNDKDVFLVIPKNALSSTTPTLTPADYTDLDTVSPMPAARTIISKSDGTTTTKAVRINVCHIKPATLKSDRIGQEAEPVEYGCRYIYVPLDRYDWQGKGDMLDNLEDIQRAIKSINGEHCPVIHGVKKHYVNKLSDDWITLDKFYAELLKQYKYDDHKAYHFGLELTCNGSYPQWNHYYRDALAKCKHPRIAKFATRIDQARTSYTNTSLKNVFNVAYMLGIIERTNYIDDELAWIKRNYPMLSIIEDLTWSSEKDGTQIINDYIDLAS